MNSKHKKTLAAVFTEPASPSIAWQDVESLLLAVGCRVIEGAGSRVRFEKNLEIETFHRPHPAKEAKRYQVRMARAFLTRSKIIPNKTSEISIVLVDENDEQSYEVQKPSGGHRVRRG